MKKYLPLSIVIVLGVALRFYHNLDISLWHDEAFSALMPHYSWGEMFYRLGLDVHPPAYYSALKLWYYPFGDSLLSLRGFSIFFSTLSIIAGWLFVKEAFRNEKAALWAAIFIAINPFQLKYVTEARMYTFGAFFALLAGYFLVKALHYITIVYRSEDKNMPNLPEAKESRMSAWCAWVGFTLCMVVMVYTHYYLFFTAAALILYAFLYLFFHKLGSWKKFVPLLVSCLLILASFLPWLKSFLYQYRQVQAGYWISKMNAWSIPSTFWDMLLGFARDTNKQSTQVFLVLVTIFTLVMLYRFLKKTDAFHKWLVVLAILAPFGGAILFALLARMKGSDSSVYLDRYFLFASVYYSVAFAVWMRQLKSKWLMTFLFFAYIILNLTAFVNYWNGLDVKSKPGMAAASNYLRSNVAQGNKIFVGTSFVYFNYKYYNQTPVAPLLYTGGEAKAENISHFAGRALLNDEDLVPNFSAGARTGETVWLIWTNGFGSSKPETPVTWSQVDERSFSEIRPYPGTAVYVTEYKVN